MKCFIVEWFLVVRHSVSATFVNLKPLAVIASGADAPDNITTFIASPEFGNLLERNLLTTMISVSLEEAQERLAELPETALAGETVEIRFNGRKAKLEVIKSDEQKPAAEPPPRQWGLLKGKGWMSDDFNEPLDDFKEYMQ